LLGKAFLTFLYRQISEKMNKKRASKMPETCPPKCQNPGIPAPGSGKGDKMEKDMVLQIYYFRNLARLSKKAPWLLHAISGSLKIKKLQTMENQKMIEFGVFRQARYFPLVFGGLKSFDMQTIYAIM
jgi:hypothetical protein